MGEMYCPNCGHHLVAYRTDRQAAGRREVVLQWMICQNCRHVGLKTWRFADGTLPGSDREDAAASEEVPERRLASG